ncbi:MAG: metallophosphatase [Candidatus Omnitrophota bacterium]
MVREVKSLTQNLKFFILICGFTFSFLSFTLTCYAQDITIIYTGETHAMLYPCSCPKEPDGGIARRATLIKKIRKENPDALLLDSGGFLSGGLMDEYTQNVELDTQRALVNLKAIELMQYDALAIGDDEFNFGRDFLKENTGKANLAFLSCNIFTTTSSGANTALFKPYVIKEVAGVKIGIIAVTGLSARQKATGLEFLDPKLAVRQAVEGLKENDADIILLLSHLGEAEDLNLIKDIGDIDILIVGHNRVKEEPFAKIGPTLILRPSWQGRKLGKLALTLKDKKIADYKVEDLRLSDKIKDDQGILAILPRCFSDNNCKQATRTGICQDAGTLKANCQFPKASRVSLSVIAPKQCRVCDTEIVVNNLKTLFPGLTTSYLYYPDTKATKLINDFGIQTLPVYLLGKEVRQEKGFDNLRDNLEAKGNFYMLKPQFSGLSYFLKRENVKEKLDLFISLYDKDTLQLLDVTKDFNPAIHFLTVEQKDTFDAGKGILEVEEDLRSVCVQKYYPETFWNYISCRAKNINSSWWQDCLENSDPVRIETCARGIEGKALLKENIRLNQELGIMFGPTYLLNNQEIFGSRTVPKKEDFQKLINKK